MAHGSTTLVRDAFAVDVLALGVVAVVVVGDATGYDKDNVGKVLDVGGRESASGRCDVAMTVVKTARKVIEGP